MDNLEDEVNHILLEKYKLNEDIKNIVVQNIKNKYKDGLPDVTVLYKVQFDIHKPEVPALLFEKIFYLNHILSQIVEKSFSDEFKFHCYKNLGISEYFAAKNMRKLHNSKYSLRKSVINLEKALRFDVEFRKNYIIEILSDAYYRLAKKYDKNFKRKMHYYNMALKRRNSLSELKSDTFEINHFSKLAKIHYQISCYSEEDSKLLHLKQAYENLLKSFELWGAYLLDKLMCAYIVKELFDMTSNPEYWHAFDQTIKEIETLKDKTTFNAWQKEKFLNGFEKIKMSYNVLKKKLNEK